MPFKTTAVKLNSYQKEHVLLLNMFNVHWSPSLVAWGKKPMQHMQKWISVRHVLSSTINYFCKTITDVHLQIIMLIEYTVNASETLLKELTYLLYDRILDWSWEMGVVWANVKWLLLGGGIVTFLWVFLTNLLVLIILDMVSSMTFLCAQQCISATFLEIYSSCITEGMLLA